MTRFSRLKSYSAFLLLAAMSSQAMLACSDEPNDDNTADADASDGKAPNPGNNKGDADADVNKPGDGDGDADVNKPGDGDGDASKPEPTDGDADVKDGDADADGGGGGPINPIVKGLVSIKVEAASKKAAVGTVVPLRVTGVYDDGRQIEINKLSDLQVTLQADSPFEKTTDYGVLAVFAKKAGKGTIIVTETSKNLSAPVEVEVTDAKIESLAVTARQARIAKGLFQAFKAVATFNDKSKQDVTLQTTWKFEPATAVGEAPGFARFETKEKATVKVTGAFGGLEGQTEFEISDAEITDVAFKAPAEKLSLRTTGRLAVEATYTDKSKGDVSQGLKWESSNPAVLLVDEAGLLTAAGLGKADITVNTANGKQAKVTIEVTEATLDGLALQADDSTGAPIDTIAALKTRKLKLVGTYSDLTQQNLSGQADWKSSDVSILSVDNGVNKGLLTAKAPGKATITVTFGEKKPVTQEITVTE